jgi:catechol 2,3-dioxygenase-like lactoylglutathione lyase family enzyme
MNMQGGGGFEIWQYTSRKPRSPILLPRLGDTGIFAVKIRCKKVQDAYNFLQHCGIDIIQSISKNPAGQLHFYVTDPFQNYFEIIEDDYWFSKQSHPIGGVCGAVIGVSNIEKSVAFYRTSLGYDIICADKEKVFNDWQGLEGSKEKLRRVLLKHKENYCGPFSRLLGPTTIELVQQVERTPAKIFDGRYWGDLGFIHICYDVSSIKQQEIVCGKAGHSFTVNSNNSFDMGKAAGQFAYNEDPDGTLIEYVETHKVPILKKLNWYLDLRKRKQVKPLPDWMVRCLGFGNKSLQLSS